MVVMGEDQVETYPYQRRQSFPELVIWNCFQTFSSSHKLHKDESQHPVEKEEDEKSEKQDIPPFLDARVTITGKIS
jgi:hypothetical protein